jgi:hypothetical protein
MRQGRPLPYSHLPRLLGSAIAAITVLAAVLLLIRP